MTLKQYSDSLFPFEDELLTTIREDASRQGLPAIQIPSDLGRILQFLVLQIRPKRVLEIGTLFGYSAIVMARMLPEGGRIVSLEADPVHASTARVNLERAGVAEIVTVREGPALATLETLRGEEFDLVFIDANKDGYPDYLRAALNLTHPGSIIVADNLWRDGGVCDPGESDTSTRGAARFNQALAESSRLFSIMIPTRDCSDAVSVSLVMDRSRS